MKELLAKTNILYHGDDFESKDDILAAVADDLETGRLFDYGIDDDDELTSGDCVL
jgi:hypothetical protein